MAADVDLFFLLNTTGLRTVVMKKNCWQTASRNPPRFELKALFEADRSEFLSTSSRHSLREPARILGGVAPMFGITH
jgi:hypothetical protein